MSGAPCWTAWTFVAMAASAGCGSSDGSQGTPLAPGTLGAAGDDAGPATGAGNNNDAGGSPGSLSTNDSGGGLTGNEPPAEGGAAPSHPGASSDATAGTGSGTTAGGGADGDAAAKDAAPPTDATAADEDAGSACAGGQALSASTAAGVTASSAYAAVKWIVAGSTELSGLWTTLVVPAKPSATNGTLYVWPGVQPYSDSANFEPIGDGILQPVLSVGPTCAPGAPSDYASWWISGQYVNVSTSAGGPTGCLGGPGMDVAVGDQLDIAMTLAGTTWTQVVTSRQTGKSVQFPMDLKGQGQNWVTLAIEIPSALLPTSDVVFTDTRLQFAAASPSSCQPSQHGPTDYFATPYVSKDGTSCCVSRVILRAQGVPATTANGP